MAVNLLPPDPDDLYAVAGVELGFAEAGIRKANRSDVMLMRFAPGTVVAGVFTRNSFAAAPVQLCRAHLAHGESIRALIVNAGNANCGTGAAGLAAAKRTCEAVAEAIGCTASQVLPFSTGVILELLPSEKIVAALPQCIESLGAARWAEAAGAIMTTDTVPKATSRRVELDGAVVTMTGIAKGVGMLEPNMATMLAFIAMDAPIAPGLLQTLVSDAANTTFNCVTVDGDTSTNDSFVIAATGQATMAEITTAADPRYPVLFAALEDLAAELARAIARDGEGATKFITIDVVGAADDAEARRVAKSIANSPLVKTALFASDPNLGRLLMAIGNAGVAGLDVAGVQLYLGDVRVIANGERSATYTELDGQRVMAPAEISIRVELGRALGRAKVWTCDFSYDYVKINAEYRT